MKLFGKKLDQEMDIRRNIKENRLLERKTIRQKAEEMGMKLSKYLDYENGRDICPHKEYRMSLAGVHKPFFLMKVCTRCKKTRILAKIKNPEDCDKYKKELEEALHNVRPDASREKGSPS